MAEKKSEKKTDTGVLSADERAAMKEYVAETRRSRKSTPEDDLQALLDKIAAMAPADRAMAEQIHAIVTEAAPQLAPKLWYGMPGYARDGKNVVFFQDAAKFKARYSTLGFNESARLDDGAMWPTSYALTELTAAAQKQIAELVRRAAG